MTPIKVTTTLRVESSPGAKDAVWRAIAHLAHTARMEGFATKSDGGGFVEIERRGPMLPTEVPSIAAALANVYAVAGRPL